MVLEILLFGFGKVLEFFLKEFERTQVILSKLLLIISVQFMLLLQFVIKI